MLATNVTVDDGSAEGTRACSNGCEAGDRARSPKDGGSQHSGGGVERRVATACPMD